MNLYINDFSYQPQLADVDNERLLKDFLDVCERAQKCSFEKIFMPNNYKAKEIVEGFSLSHYIDNAKKGSPLLLRLKSLIANQLKKIDLDENDPQIQYVEYKTQESEFLKRAYNRNFPVISYRTHNDFEANIIPIKNKQLNENGEIIESDGEVLNISKVDHFNNHKDYLNQKQLAQAELEHNWDALITPLRFTNRIAQYLDDINYDKRLTNLEANQRVSLVKDVGRLIAEMNGWQYNSALSKKNGRLVFKAFNQAVYLSIDTMHGSFELQDKKGNHQGEYNYKGKKIDGADTSAKHNIKL